MLRLIFKKSNLIINFLLTGQLLIKYKIFQIYIYITLSKDLLNLKSLYY